MRQRNLQESKNYRILFDTTTPSGHKIEIILMVAILLSLVAVSLESVQSVKDQYPAVFYYAEWGFTILFTVEYLLRVFTAKNPKSYIFSFYGLIDLVAILPSFLGLFSIGGNDLLVVRSLRLLRVFRILKLGKYVSASNLLVESLKASMSKILAFLFFVMIIVIINGAVLYAIESETNPSFSSIPRGIYWAIVTLTTVGYGDIYPQTSLGQFLAAAVMLLGYAILVVPTGIVSAEMVNKSKEDFNKNFCTYCKEKGHEKDANFCKKCGEKLPKEE